MAGGPIGGHGPNRVIEFAVDKRLFPADGVSAVGAIALAFILAPQQVYSDVQPAVWKSAVSGQTPRLIPRVSASPQLADLTQQAYFEAPTPLGQGRVPAPTFGIPQTDPSQLAASAWRSVIAGQTPPIIPRVGAAPQLLDLTQQAVLFKPLTTPQGPVPPITAGAPQTDPSQISAVIWKSQPAAPVVANPIASYFSIPPQIEDRPGTPIWKSLVAGQTPPVIPFLRAVPQQADLTQQGVIILSARTPPAIGPVPPFTFGIAQADPSQLPAQVWQSLQTPPAIVGVTVWPMAPTPPQFDPSINATAFWTPSTFSPSGPPPAPTVILDSGVRHHRPLVIKARDFEKREDLAAFLKAQLKLRTPTAVEEIPATAEALQASDIPSVPVLSEQERAKLLSDEKQRTTAINNQILAMILAMYDDDES